MAAASPRFLTSVILVISLLAIPLFFDLPGDLRLVAALQNSGHALLFAVIALVARGVWRWSAFRTLALCALAGAAIEIVQFFTGRDCDPRDWGLDILGTLAGLALFFGIAGRQWRGWLMAMLLILVACYQPLRLAVLYVQQARQFPVLCDFEQPALRDLMSFYEGVEVELVPAPEQWQSNRTQVALLRFPTAGWPGLSLFDLAENWQGYSYLEVEVWSPNTTAVDFAIALRGRNNRSDHHDLSRHFVVQPGLNRIQLPLNDLAEMESGGVKLLANVQQVIVFSSSPPPGTQLYIDNLRLGP